MTEGVQFAEGIGQGAGSGEGLTPSVVGVGDDFCAGIVDEGDDVALQVMDVVELPWRICRRLYVFIRCSGGFFLQGGGGEVRGSC